MFSSIRNFDLRYGCHGLSPAVRQHASPLSVDAGQDLDENGDWRWLIYTIGTAGHIDHGKTSLCEAITGTNTDRLAQEKERGISIELGFAHFETPRGRRVGLVDVPGHERFIRNMVAGVAGMEGVLITIAADEGIMPQTREHVDILALLGVDHAVIALTKCDLVDEDWLGLVEEDIRAFFEKTRFQSAELVRTSVRVKSTFPPLLVAIDAMIDKIDHADSSGSFRLPIDRVFTLKGHGTIVTGTIASGTIRIGEHIELLPQGIESRVRGIQSFNELADAASAGQRAGLNLPDLELGQVERGSVCCRKGAFTATTRVDGRVTLLASLPGASQIVKDGARVRFYVGTAEVMARIYTMDGQKELRAGDSQLARLHLESPVVTARNDRFLLRTYSPLHTIGGGVVLDSNPASRKRDHLVSERLVSLEKADAGTVVLERLGGRDLFWTVEELVRETGIETEGVLRVLNDRGEQVAYIEGKNRQYYLLRRLDEGGQKILDIVQAYHEEYPLKLGMERSALLTAFNRRMAPSDFNAFLGLVADRIRLQFDGHLVRDDSFSPQVSAVDESRITTLRRILEEQGFCTAGQLESSCGLKRQEFNQIMNLLLGRGDVVKLSDGQLGLREAVSEYERKLVILLEAEGTAGIGPIKSSLGLTRKSLIPLLEYFDGRGLTIRSGSERRLKIKRS